MTKENKAMLLMLTCATLWSIGGIFIKLLPWNPFAIASLRSLFAGLTVWLYIITKRYRIILNRRTIVSALFMSALYLCFVCANKLTTAANAIVLQFTSPIFIVIISALVFKERIKRRDLVAVIFTLAGISLFFFDKLEGGYLTGNLLAILAGALMACMYICIGKAKSEERFSSILLAQVFVFLAGLPFIITTQPQLSGLPLLYIIILGVFQIGLPYILYAKSTEHCPPLACCLLGAAEPLLNPLWVFIFNGEKPGVFAFIGGIAVIITVTLWCAIKEKAEKDYA